MQQERTEQLARLWTESQPVVASYILSLVRDFHAAEDILQQVAVVLVREFEKYDPARPFLPWALGIAKNVALKSRREMSKDVSLLLDTELLDQIQVGFEENLGAWTALRQALQTCLQKQHERMREVLRWRYAFDLKPQEVAARMGITSGAVRVMLHRARMALRECIQHRLRAAGE
jgi:RNA polymerase sigma-70 factor (ECF subfamily)